MMNYAGFWRRFGAFWLDFLIISPIILLTLWGKQQSRYFDIYYFIPGLVFWLWYEVYLVKRYGGTPGKLILRIRIAKLDGSPVEYRQATIRYSVLFVFSTIMSITSIMANLSISDDVYNSMQWVERSHHIMSVMPPWYMPLNILMNIWTWSEFIVMLTNRKRRAIHDFMAGTVVLLKDEPNKSHEANHQ